MTTGGSPDDAAWPESRRRRIKLALFRGARVIVLPLLRLLLGMRIEGLENVPPRGGALVVANHLHNSDPILLIAAFPRPVFFMAKSDVWRVPVARWFAELSGAFPVERGRPDRKALRHAEQELARGWLVGVFPEGGRSTTGALKSPYPGVALIAARSRVPIIPTAIWGTEVLPFNGKKGRRKGKGWPKVRVRMGKPFYLPEGTGDGSRPDLATLTDLMMIEVAKLLPPEYRGIYADRVAEAAAEPHPSPTPLPTAGEERR
ncbi:1-acyl-sn-glycerol-3-phosphate acyltransferase [Sphaerobacter sp.]|uniref:lysophospholipid acyltransferase family protein n=1 Tax=Sphaerobacter sp. TaxID=2099654 RepID=UPI001E0525A0|nr:lysophospholipid acyltransferase family protein [Sphaerobacter sp.]MBX5444601.1 1-acyl-sn-glycerol-3-phosphate acyltransferase [Sphaerobacter sp.]